MLIQKLELTDNEVLRIDQALEIAIHTPDKNIEHFLYHPNNQDYEGEFNEIDPEEKKREVKNFKSNLIVLQRTIYQMGGGRLTLSVIEN